MTYLGIVLHTRNMTICEVSSNGMKIGEWKLINQTEQLDDVIRQIDRPVKAVVEAPDSRWGRFARSGGNKPVKTCPTLGGCLEACSSIS